VSLAETLNVTAEAERALADALLEISRRHASEPDIRETARLLAGWSWDHTRALAAGRARLDRRASGVGWRVPRPLFESLPQGGAGLLRDLHELTSCVAFVEACWTILLQAARASHDRDLEQTCWTCGAETLRQRAWLNTKLGQVAPQALTVPVLRPHEQRGRSSAAAAPRRTAAPNVSRSRTQAPLVAGILAGLGQAVASRRRGRSRTRASTVSSILVGVGLGWAGSTVIRALVDGSRARRLSFGRHQGLRGPTRTARLGET
jgi:hypothetical protein